MIDLKKLWQDLIVYSLRRSTHVYWFTFIFLSSFLMATHTNNMWEKIFVSMSVCSPGTKLYQYQVKWIDKGLSHDIAHGFSFAIDTFLRDDAQNTTNPAISLVVYIVIPLLIGPSVWAPITSIMCHVGEGTQPCAFPVTGNGHGRVTEIKHGNESDDGTG